MSPRSGDDHRLAFAGAMPSDCERKLDAAIIDNEDGKPHIVKRVDHLRPKPFQRHAAIDDAHQIEGVRELEIGKAIPSERSYARPMVGSELLRHENGKRRWSQL